MNIHIYIQLFLFIICIHTARAPVAGRCRWVLARVNDAAAAKKHGPATEVEQHEDFGTAFSLWGGGKMALPPPTFYPPQKTTTTTKTRTQNIEMEFCLPRPFQNSPQAKLFMDCVKQKRYLLPTTYLF